LDGDLDSRDVVPVQHDVVAIGAERRRGPEERPHLVEQARPERPKLPPGRVRLDDRRRTLRCSLDRYVVRHRSCKHRSRSSLAFGQPPNARSAAGIPPETGLPILGSTPELPRRPRAKSEREELMNSSLISKIEKAKRYAAEPDRIQFQTLDVSFRGDNGTHRIRLS